MMGLIMARLPFSIFLFVILQVLVFLLVGLFYFWLGYEDELVTEGEALGFRIGQTKERVYDSAFRSLSALSGGRTEIFIPVKVSGDMSSAIGVKQDFEVLAQTYLHDIGFADFRNRDTWTFYLNASRLNVVKLSFCGDKLCEIYRHKKVLEL